MNQHRKTLLWYFLIVLFFSSLLACGISRFGRSGTALVNAMMFIPGLVSIFFRYRRKEGFQSVGWSLRPSFFWIWALLFPILLLSTSLPISILLGYVSISTPSLMPNNILPFCLALTRKLVLFSILSLPFALGEELGWRGYAQEKLLREFGIVKGFLILGIVWGFWHSPAFYFLGLFPNHTILGPFVMTPVDNILMVVPLGWLYIRSRSIWVPAIAHSFGNVLWGYSDTFISKHSELGSWGVLQVIQLAVTIACLIDTKKRPFIKNQGV
ncbi:MAG: type II CAAX endopeptidase family protein [Elusimicrobiales bacterium]|nr:type II CAAX endopeptidase family protein [Elusimicrobiales bacterium]